MILTCPSCGTRYVVKDGAIPPEGRTVRCAQCKHSWHQDGQEAAEAVEPEGALLAQEPDPAVGKEADRATAPVREEEGTPSSSEGEWQVEEPSPASEAPEAGPQAEEPLADVSSDPPVSTTAAFTSDHEPQPSHDVAPADRADEAFAGDEPDAERTSHPMRAARTEQEDYSPFAAYDEEEQAPRRRWPLWLAAVLVIVALAAAAIWFLAPAEFKSRLGLAQAGESPLMVQLRQSSRQELASGNNLFEVSGVVINPTEKTVTVPPINAQLRSLEQKVVYSWVIPPPAPQLAPGASASFNSANLDVPGNAACVDLAFVGDDRQPPPCRQAQAGGA